MEEQSLKEKLKEHFGYTSFRGNQEKVIQNLLKGNDTFVIMPTGAGKSMCYQLPAMLLDGMAIVVSPLIALMKNQVDQLQARGINAHFLNSTLTKGESNRVKKEIREGRAKLLYVAPESLTKVENIELLSSVKISFVAVDEVHCISEWGHDFRPEYRKIKSIIKEIGDFPVIALTATATPKVQIDIQKNLNMDDATVFKSSFFRKNLYYEVRPKTNSKKQLIQFLSERKGQAGIIYCLSRKKVEELAEFLQVNGFNAKPYHAGFDTHVRERNQDAFLNEDVDIIVATIAFGMGIDKPDVRFVVHFDAPKSLEGYYQETGRAGRDSKESFCLMFYSYADIIKLDKFNKDKPVTEKENARLLLDEVVSYSESSLCRTRQLLHYFGEHLDEDCGFCDNCKNPPKTFEAKDDVLAALKSIDLAGGRFGIKHIVNILRGSKSSEILSYSHDKMPTYGFGKDKDEFYWIALIRQLLVKEYIEKDIDNYGVFLLTEQGKSFIRNPTQIELTEAHHYPEEDDKEEIPENYHGENQSRDHTLFDLLKKLRKEVAKEKGLPPYVIFQEESLVEMATTFPTSMEDLSHIQGVGQGKAVKFGQAFVELIQEYVTENDISTMHDVFVKTSAKKSKNKIHIIQQIDKKIDLDEIARNLGLSFHNLVTEMEHICHSGTKLNIDYYLNDLLDEDSQEDIYNYFLEIEVDNMEEVLAELGEDYSEEEILLMHIKFISEVAN